MNFLHSRKQKFEQVCSTNFIKWLYKFYHMALMLNKESMQKFMEKGRGQLFLEKSNPFLTEIKCKLLCSTNFLILLPNCYQRVIYVNKEYSQVGLKFGVKIAGKNSKKQKQEGCNCDQEKFPRGGDCKNLVLFPVEAVEGMGASMP